MEYSALDDSKAKQEAADAEAEALLGDGETEGFLLTRLIERKPELKTELLTFREALLASASQDQTLKVWDLKDLGLQASQRILASADPLALLTETAQNFPALASPLSRLHVSASLRAEAAANARVLQAGASFLLLNGQYVDLASLDINTLLQRVRQETRLAGLLSETQLPADDVAALLALRSEATSDAGSEQRLDISAAAGQRDPVLWLNDLESDRQYRRWPHELQELLRPVYPGQMHSIARNLFNLVVVADLATSEGLAVAVAIDSMIGEQWPVRVGILPVSADAAGEAALWKDASPSAQVARALLAMKQAWGTSAASSFLASLGSLAVTSHRAPVKPLQLNTAQVEAEFARVWEGYAGEPDLEKDEEQEENQELASLTPAEALTHLREGTGFADGAAAETAATYAFVQAKGLSGSNVPQLIVNGIVIPSQARAPSVAMWRQLTMAVVQQETRLLQEWVYYGKLEDDSEEPLLAAIMHISGALPRHNPRILPSIDSDEPAARQVAVGERLLQGVSGGVGGQSQYLHAAGSQDDVKAATHWVVVDAADPAGRQLVLHALDFIDGKAGDAVASRLAIVHNPAAPPQQPTALQRLLLAAASVPSRRTKLPGFLRELLSATELVEMLAAAESDAAQSALSKALELAEQAGLNRKGLEQLLEADEAAAAAALKQHAALAREALSLPPGAAAVVTNGRIVLATPPADAAATGDTQPLVAGDFALLQAHAARGQMASGAADAVTAALEAGRLNQQGSDDEEPEPSSEQLSDIVMIASSVLSAHGGKLDQRSGKLAAAMDSLSDRHIGVHLSPVSSAPGQPPSAVTARVLLDPLSKSTQRLAPMLQLLREATGLGLRLILNPIEELSDLPLKSYYRYALPEFAAAEGGTAGQPLPPAAKFAALPGRQVLTLNMDVPEAWLVEAVNAEADLDNLKLAELPVAADGSTALHAEFQLEALLLTGQCIDPGAKTRDKVTPRGVQLWLGHSKQRHVKDTLVMSNLGYFQLQASPGAWTLRLAPGRSQELYYITPNGSAFPEDDQDRIETPAVIDNLSGKQVQLRVRKRPGKEAEDVLDDSSSGSGGETVWGKLFGSKPGDAVAETRVKDDRVHIFTVASGHMYERLQKIMILSVIRNTESRVKVWFIKNYMSPQMRAFVPAMAAKYGFDYEFVTYKWPSWLHKQTEKQRIIWAYKILFLDVLFPLDLKKVIFLDADQIIRADIKELHDHDLQGAPYGYTPFCDNNKEMDGFRFWRQGFWEGHLRGKPYHISALYVVDLVRFRQTAAGDQLRVIYDTLSKDPNSLSNLDQDLPNYAQHQVPIHSLPQEWLWCETWCGNTTKAAAKTIDLCNNPLTKEPKLDNARRIVAEWPALDQEAREFTAEVEAEALQGAEASLSASLENAADSSGGGSAPSSSGDIDFAAKAANSGEGSDAEPAGSDADVSNAAAAGGQQAPSAVQQEAGEVDEDAPEVWDPEEEGQGAQQDDDEEVPANFTPEEWAQWKADSAAGKFDAQDDEDEAADEEEEEEEEAEDVAAAGGDIRGTIAKLKAKLDAAKNADDYLPMPPKKAALLQKRVELAAKCVMERDEAACKEIETLPHLDEVEEDEEEGGEEEDVGSSEATAEARQRVLDAVENVASKSKQNAAAMRQQQQAAHDEL